MDFNRYIFISISSINCPLDVSGYSTVIGDPSFQDTTLGPTEWFTGKLLEYMFAMIWVKTFERCTIGSKKAKIAKHFIRLKTLILAKSPICPLENAPDNTGILPADPFLFKVEMYHVSSANISDFKKPIFSRFH